ncbi:RICIN domain-containing protein, partial [Actinoplanes sp. RD1]|uniref:RICIN domain-containing protein n=1 Tax=Actinoplanes sp. RD1 TaxID=3064538 RepID=UPI0027412EFC
MVAALVVAVAGVGVGATAAEAAITPAAGILIKIANADKCVNVKGGSLLDSAAIIQQACNDSFTSEKWRVVPKAGGYQIVNNLSGKCLNVPNSQTANDVQIVQYTCNDTATNNLWKIEPVAGKTTLRVRSVGTSKCLSVKGNGSADQTSIVQYTCSTADTGLNHQFYFPPAAATFTALEPQVKGPIVGVQGGAAAGAAIGPIVYAYTNDAGHVYRAYQENPDITSGITWEALPALDQYAGHPTVAVQADGRVQVGVRGAVDGDLSLSTQATKGQNMFGALADVGGSSASQPVTGKLPDGKLVTFALVGGSLWHLPQDGTYLPYGAWRQIGGSGLVGEPALVTVRDTK